jgi:hypothetical protein
MAASGACSQLRKGREDVARTVIVIVGVAQEAVLRVA